MKLEIDLFDSESIEQAIKALKVLQGAIYVGTGLGVETIAKDAKELAEMLYDGAGDVTVSDEVYPGDVDGQYIGKVYADGEQLAFVEFGAGYGAIGDNPLPETGIDTSPGSWSREFGTGEFWNSMQNSEGGGQWHYMGQAYREVPRHLGMTNAKILAKTFTTQRVKEKIEEMTQRAGY